MAAMGFSQLEGSHGDAVAETERLQSELLALNNDTVQGLLRCRAQRSANSSLRLRLERRARPGNDDRVRWSADDFRSAGVDTASLVHEITSEDLAQMQRSKDAIDSTHARIAATQSEARMVLGLEESAANARRERSAVKMEMQVSQLLCDSLRVAMERFDAVADRQRVIMDTTERQTSTDWHLTEKTTCGVHKDTRPGHVTCSEESGDALDQEVFAENAAVVAKVHLEEAEYRYDVETRSERDAAMTLLGQKRALNALRSDGRVLTEYSARSLASCEIIQRKCTVARDRLERLSREEAAESEVASSNLEESMDRLQGLVRTQEDREEHSQSLLASLQHELRLSEASCEGQRARQATLSARIAVSNRGFSLLEDALADRKRGLSSRERYFVWLQEHRNHP